MLKPARYDHLHLTRPAANDPAQNLERQPLARRAKALLIACILGYGSACANASRLDITSISLEELLQTDVYSTTNYVRSLSQNPTTVSVVTSEEIRAQGYRTLADILRSLPGLYVTYDRTYSRLGTRGFGRPEDYNGRVLFLLDGYRLNENIYDSALLGTESILDVELIARLEYIAGPGSAILHGQNAFFGVVNIITKKGAGLDGLEVSGEVGSAGTSKARASFGRRLDNGLDILLSASRYERDGRNLHFSEPDFVARGGTAIGLDHDQAERLFAKFTLGNLSLMAVHGERSKGTPNASYGQLPLEPGAETTDAQSLLDLSYNHPLGADSAISGRLYYGRYDYDGVYVYDANADSDPPQPVSPYFTRDDTAGRWVGADLRYVSPRLGAHKWLLGADYQLNLQRHQKYYVVGAEDTPDFEDRHDNQASWGLFFHDEYALSDDLTLNFGARFDQPVVGDAEAHPRLGLIYHWSPSTTLKALYGSAFRPPNAFELYYTDGLTYVVNPNLGPETIQTYELVLDQKLANAGRVSVTLFRYRISDLIDLDTLAGSDEILGTPDDVNTFANLGGARAKGVELRYDTHWEGGGRLRASYTWQVAQTDAGLWLENSPKHLAKLSLEQPLFATHWNAGLEIQYTGPRRNFLGTRIGSYSLVNLNLLNRKLAKDLEVSARITNLLDKRFADPASPSLTPLEGVTQDGREWSLRLDYWF